MLAQVVFSCSCMTLQLQSRLLPLQPRHRKLFRSSQHKLRASTRSNISLTVNFTPLIRALKGHRPCVRQPLRLPSFCVVKVAMCEDQLVPHNVCTVTVSASAAMAFQTRVSRGEPSLLLNYDRLSRIVGSDHLGALPDRGAVVPPSVFGRLLYDLPRDLRSCEGYQAQKSAQPRLAPLLEQCVACHPGGVRQGPCVSVALALCS